MKVHELKTWPQQFLELRAKTKKHEYRRNDRAFEAGDILVLREWTPPASPGLVGLYTGEVVVRRITSITRGPDFDVPEGYAVMSLEQTS